MTWKNFFLLAGPLSFLIIKYIIHFEGLSPEGQAVLACTCWVAIWWISEAAELPVTSILPLAILPLAGGLTIDQTATSYANPLIFLFMGGFIIGLAIEKWGLHQRIAYKIIDFVGKGEKRMILGFMLATGFLSMWLSNTATTIMMLPIGLSVIKHMDERQPFSRSLMLGIAYAASIGGMATLIGTPPNLILAGVVREAFQIEISFLQWMMFAFPLSLLLLFVTWFYLTRYKVREDDRAEDLALLELGKMSLQEKRVLAIFSLVAFLWITRSFIWNTVIPGLDDTIIAIVGALLMFLVPAGEGKGMLMNWNSAKKLPWDVLLIFGAGLAIAKGFSQTDLASWLAMQFMAANFLPAMLISLLVIAGINFLTEVTSNTATASMILPLLITLTAALGIPPIPLLAGAAIAASCAFMLPVATPPNAIVFSSGKIRIGEMARIGLWLNLTSIFFIFLFIYYWWPVVWTS